MNCKRGFKRLLIILFFVVGIVVLSTQAEGDRWGALGGLIVLWLGFLLLGFVAYCILRLLELIGYLFFWVLNRGKSSGRKRRINLKKEFRELTWVSAGVSSVLLFFIVLAIETKGIDPDYLIPLVFSLIVSIVSFGLVWAIYAVILFIVRGFLDSETGG